MGLQFESVGFGRKSHEMIKKAMFYDFDGIIIDSISESYYLSKEVFFGFAILGPEEKEIKSLFYKYRGLVGPSYQFCILMESIKKYMNNEIGNIPNTFNYLDKKISNNKKKKFEFLFFQTRRFNQSNIKDWLQLHTLTDFGRTLVSKSLDHHYIITTKDKRSVDLLLKYFDIHPKKIYDREFYEKMDSKGNIISDFLNSTDFDKAVFIDDSIDHLKSVNDNRVDCYFGDWGYGENDKNSSFPVYKFS